MSRFLCAALFPWQTKESCDQEMQGQAGHFNSPGYPFQYPNDAKCNYSIEVPVVFILIIFEIQFSLTRRGQGIEPCEVWDSQHVWACGDIPA